MHRHLCRIAVPALALLCGVAACSRITDPPSEPVQDLALAVGDAARLSSAMVRVVAVQDSRCPSDVVCFTAGDVVMVLAFSGAGNARTDTLRLFTTPKSSTYGGFLFTPLRVLPYPRTDGPNVPKTLTLHVTDAP
jgi:hypothetical protein